MTRDGPSAEKTRRRHGAGAAAPSLPVQSHRARSIRRAHFGGRFRPCGLSPFVAVAASRKLSVVLMNRSAIAPLAGAALVPFAIAGATKLPYKEMFSLVKKLLVL